MEWIPSNPGDALIEEDAREIVKVARDVFEQMVASPEPGHMKVVCVKYKNAEKANRVVDCLNERYLGAYSYMIEVKLLH